MMTRAGDIGGTGAGTGGRSPDVIDHDPSPGREIETGDIVAEVAVGDVTITVIEVGDLPDETVIGVPDLVIAEILQEATRKTGEQVQETTQS